MKQLFVVLACVFVLALPMSLAVVAPSSSVSISSSTSSSSTSFSVSSSDAITFDTGYYSVDGSQWQSFALSGSVLDSDWLSGSASGNLGVARSDVNQNVYVIVFSCSLVNSAWDCHGDDWQILEGFVAALPQDEDPTPPPQVDGNAWSDPATWSSMGMSVPQQGDVVMIPQGERVVLDVSPPSLDGIMVNGVLEFAHTDLDVTTDYIKVMGEGAELIIGTEAEPYTGDVLITLTGTEQEVLDAESANVHCGYKVVCSMNGGRLELISDYAGPSWTRLADGNTAEVGDTSIKLEQSVNWDVGDEIVIVSTDFDPGQAEKRTITAVNGNRVSFNEPLQFMHYGKEYCREGYCIDMRAEVMHLTRNIKIQGDASSVNSQIGGHLMAMNEHSSQQFQRFASGEEFVDIWDDYINSDFAKPKIDGVELYRMGQQGILARYPIHWHMYGDASNSYVKNTAVHDSFQRCYTIHGTQNALLENNVAYNVVGHCYFLEDGAEWDNTLHRNVGALVRNYPNSNDHLIPGDNRPSVFWWTNTQNTFTENVAAGAFGFGFWLEPKFHPDGPSATESINLHDVERGEFGIYRDNVAHSTVFSNFEPASIADPRKTQDFLTGLGGVGFMIGERDKRFKDPGGIRCTTHNRPDGQRCDFVGGAIYKNQFGASFKPSTSHSWVRPVRMHFADNQLDAFTHMGAHEEDNVFFAYSDNVGTPGSWKQGSVPLRDNFKNWNYNVDLDDINSHERSIGRSIYPHETQKQTQWAINWQYDGGFGGGNVFIDYHDDPNFERGAITNPGNSHVIVMLENVLINSDAYLPPKAALLGSVVRHDGSLDGTNRYGEVRFNIDGASKQNKGGEFLFHDGTCSDVPTENYKLCYGVSGWMNSLSIDGSGDSQTTATDLRTGRNAVAGEFMPMQTTYLIDANSNTHNFELSVQHTPRDSWIIFALPQDQPYSRDIQIFVRGVNGDTTAHVNTPEELCASTQYVTLYWDPSRNIQYIKATGMGAPRIPNWEYVEREAPFSGYSITLNQHGSTNGFEAANDYVICDRDFD